MVYVECECRFTVSGWMLRNYSEDAPRCLESKYSFRTPVDVLLFICAFFADQSMAGLADVKF